MAVDMTQQTAFVKQNWTRSPAGQFLGLDKTGTSGGGGSSGDLLPDIPAGALYVHNSGS